MPHAGTAAGGEPHGGHHTPPAEFQGAESGVPFGGQSYEDRFAADATVPAAPPQPTDWPAPPVTMTGPVDPSAPAGAGYAETPTDAGYAQTPAAAGYGETPAGAGYAEMPAGAGYAAPAGAAYPAGYPGAAMPPGATMPPSPMMAPSLPQPVVKKPRTGLIVGLIVVIVLVLCGGVATTVGVVAARHHAKPSALATSAPFLAPTPSAAPSTVAPDPTPSEPTFTGSMVKYLVPAPSGSRKVADPLGSHNVFTAKQNAALWDKDARQWRLDTLNSDGFQTGAVRQWTANGGDTIVEVDIFQFKVANGATLFFNTDTDDQGYLTTKTVQVDATTTPGGEVFYTKVKDKYGYERAYAAAQCGNAEIEVWLDQYKTISLTVINSLLFKQYKKLCP